MRFGLKSVGLAVAVASAAGVFAAGASAATGGATQLSVRGSDYGDAQLGLAGGPCTCTRPIAGR
jgi:hypothetical protein